MKEPSRFYSSLGLLILLNILVKPLWIFAIDRQVQNVVGLEAYGLYFSLFSLSIVLSFLADWGFNAFFNRQLAAQEKDFMGHAGNFLLLKILFCFIYFIVVFAVAWFSGIREWTIVFYVALIQALTSIFIFFRAIITSQQWFRAEAWLSVADKILVIFIGSVFLYMPQWAGPMTVNRFLLLQAAAIAVAILIAAFFLIKKGVHFSFYKNWLPGKTMLLAMLPFGIIVLLMAMHTRLDAFLLERIYSNGAYEAGIYAAAYRLLDASNTACYLVASFMLPYIARRWSSKEEINTGVLQCRHLLVMFSIGLASTAVFFAPWIQEILYHHDDQKAVEVLQYCLPVLVAYAFTHIYGTVLTATGKILPFCYIVFASVVINIVLNLLLIPAWGAMGCCYAALVSQVVCAAALALYTKRELRLSLEFRSLLIYIFTGILLSGFFFICKDWPIPKWLLVTTGALLTIGIMLLTKLTGVATWMGSFKKQ